MLQVCPRWGGALSSRLKPGTGGKKTPPGWAWGVMETLGMFYSLASIPGEQEAAGLCWHCPEGFRMAPGVASQQRESPGAAAKGGMWLWGEENTGKIKWEPRFVARPFLLPNSPRTRHGGILPVGFSQWDFHPSRAHPKGRGRSSLLPFKLRPQVPAVPTGRAVPAPPDVTAGVTPGPGDLSRLGRSWPWPWAGSKHPLISRPLSRWANRPGQCLIAPILVGRGSRGGGNCRGIPQRER